MFQKTINKEFAMGVVGESLFNEAFVAHTKQLMSVSDGLYNIIGRVVTQSATNPDQMRVGVGVTAGPIMGVLSGPKQYALYGTADDHLAPTMKLPQGIQAEYMASGNIIIQASTEMVSNDPTLKLYFENSTGIIGQAAAVPDDHTELVGWKVYQGAASGMPSVVSFDEAH